MTVRTSVSHGLADCLAALAVTALAGRAAAARRSASSSRAPATTAAQVATAQHGMVVSQEQRATRIGLDVLERGGNAVDAAVAVGFALAVSLPKAGNIGGGGFMVVHLAGRNEDGGDRLPRDRAGGDAGPTCSSGPKGRRTPASPATPGSASASPALWPGSRWRSSATARASSPSPS